MPHPKGVVEALKKEKKELEAKRDALPKDDAAGRSVFDERIKSAGESIKHYGSSSTKRFATAPPVKSRKRGGDKNAKKGD